MLLVEASNPSSALALLRCLNDSCNRGAWVATFAAPNQIAEILKGEYKYGNIAQTLEEKYGTGLDSEARVLLHSHTHTGYEQLSRQRSTEV